MEQFNETNEGGGMTIGMEVTAVLLIATAIQHHTAHRSQTVLDSVAVDVTAGGLSVLIAVGM